MANRHHKNIVTESWYNDKKNKKADLLPILESFCSQGLTPTAYPGLTGISLSALYTTNIGEVCLVHKKPVFIIDLNHTNRENNINIFTFLK